MAPSDAEAALRSFPRRYAEVFAPREGEDIDEIAARIGPDGVSAADVVADLARTFAMLRDAVRKTITTDTPVLHAAVVDPAERLWTAADSEPVSTSLDVLSDEATELAEHVAHVSLENWGREASVADSSGVTSVSALDLVREAVRVGHEGLDAAATALAAARS